MKQIARKIFSFSFMIVLFALIGIAVYLILSTRKVAIVENRVGAVFIGSVEDKGWNQAHYEGIKEACEKLKLPLFIEEDIAETLEATEPAVDRLVNEKKCNVILLTSDGFGDNLAPLYDKYSNIRFYTVSPEADYYNVNTYFCRLYQLRYLCGIIAGKMTKSNVIGYICGTPSCQCVRQLNAFTIGARSVNPDVVVKVKFVGSWYEPEKEKKAAMDFITKHGADIISYHTSSPFAIDIAEQMGVYSIGYNLVRTERSDNFLTAALYQWEPIYEQFLSDFQKSTVGKDKYYWLGVLYDTVSFYRFSPEIPQDVIDLVFEKEDEIKAGSDVFVDEIYSNDGKLMCKQGERIGDDAMLHTMLWYVEGVEVYD